jgi:hypothetical protein
MRYLFFVLILVVSTSCKDNGYRQRFYQCGDSIDAHVAIYDEYRKADDLDGMIREQRIATAWLDSMRVYYNKLLE